MFKTNDININGSIGYTLLENGKNKVLILSDMHSELPYCEKNGIFVSDWMKSKTKSKILLEEVPRTDSTLKELWPSSPHTQKLKELYLGNSIVINGVDVRPFLIPYSWELMNEPNIKIPIYNLRKYMEFIDNFFQIKHDYMKKELKNVYTKKYLYKSKLGDHFSEMKKNVLEYIRSNKNLLNTPISKIDKNILEKINIIISNIMEWYIIAKIYEQDNNNFVVHAGLLHTSNLNSLLIKKYNYKLINFDGIIDIEDGDKKSNGCLKLPFNINNQFGGLRR
jgi:hypothetical protein